MIASLAIATGIAPNVLMAHDAEMLATMVDILGKQGRR